MWDIISGILLFLVIAAVIIIIVLYFTGYISKTGPTGPSGIAGSAVNTGATGPTGSSGVITDYANISKTLTNNTPYQMNSRDTVLWDDPTTIHGDITYMSNNANLKIDKSGTYLITFGYSNVVFANQFSLSLDINFNFSPHTTLHEVSTGSTGQSLSVIENLTAPTYLTVINSSGNSVVFQDTETPVGSVAIYLTVFRLQ